MPKYEKTLARILSGRSDANIEFNDLRQVLTRLGFEERIRSSHHIFVYPGLEGMINLQREGHLAKPYQVRQVRTTIATHGLAEEKEP